MRQEMTVFRDQWDEMDTHWGKFWWGAFGRSHKKYMPGNSRASALEKYRQAIQYELMVMKNYRENP